MQPSMFNVRVPLEDQNEVFLMNTFTDAQLIVSTDVAALLDELEHRDAAGWTTRSATPSARSPSTVSSSRAATPIATTSSGSSPRSARAASSCA